MQILLLFYTGHGRLKNGKPCAVGVDGKLVNLYGKFVQALNKASAQSTTLSIVLLMDASLYTESSEPGAPARPKPPVSKDSDNLIVCAHACQPGEHAFFGLEGSNWTDALIQSMRHSDDLLTILMRSSDHLRKWGTEKQQPWVAWNQNARRMRCSLARYAADIHS